MLSIQQLIQLRNKEAEKGHQFNVDVLNDILESRDKCKSCRWGWEAFPRWPPTICTRYNRHLITGYGITEPLDICGGKGYEPKTKTEENENENRR